MAKKKKQVEIPEINYITEAKPRAVADGIPVFCAFDKIEPIGKLVPNPGNPNKHPEYQYDLKCIRDGKELPIDKVMAIIGSSDGGGDNN